METLNYDVVIMGGGLAGSLTAINIIKHNPQARIAIIEQSSHFPKKVGESTSDITAIFMRRFGLNDILDKQIQKTGLRFFFNDETNEDLSRSSNYSSPSTKSIANGFQFNRGSFDEALLKKAKESGVDIFRPWKVVQWAYSEFQSSVEIHSEAEKKQISCRWLVDACGRQALVAKKMAWHKIYDSHPTASSWAHFSGLKRIDELDNDTSNWWNKRCIGNRQFATTHFLNTGYWVWHIPLHDNTVSLGIVYDKRIINKEEAHPRDYFFKFLKSHPTLKHIVKDATWENYRHLPHLPYTSDHIVQPGLALVGDAAGFVDPLFSPGMEFTCQQVLWLGPLIAKELQTKIYCTKSWKKYENLVLSGVLSRFNLYKDRYYLMGDCKTFALLSQLDFAGYYTNLIIPSALYPSFLKTVGVFPSWLSWIYNKIKYRLIRLTEKRARLGLNKKENLNLKTYSHARIPPNISVVWRGPFMMSLFIFRYLEAELQVLFEKAKGSLSSRKKVSLSS